MRTPQQQTAGDGYVLALAEHLLVTLAVVAGIERTAGDVQLAELVFLFGQRLVRQRDRHRRQHLVRLIVIFLFHHIVV